MIRFLTILEIFLVGAVAGASAFPFEKQFIRNIVKVEAYGGCGTAFVLNGGLVVTNAHVMEGACTQEKCEGIKIYRSANLGEKPELFKEIDFKIKANFPATDLIILEATENLFPGGIGGKVDVPLNKEKLFSYGFPHCDKLERFEGEVQELKKFNFGLGFSGVRGQSGSPILNHKGNIIGVLNKVSEFKDTEVPVELMASRIDRYMSDLTKVGSNHIEVELLDQYEDFFSSVASAPSKLSMILRTSNHAFRQSEVQFNLSGLCLELKDFFLWKSINFRSHVAAPKVSVENLNPSCGLIFKYSLKAGIFSEMMAASNLGILEMIPIDQYSSIAAIETFKARDDWYKIMNSKPWLSGKEIQYLLWAMIGALFLGWIVFILFRKYKTPRKIFRYFLVGLITLTLVHSFFV